MLSELQKLKTIQVLLTGQHVTFWLRCYVHLLAYLITPQLSTNRQKQTKNKNQETLVAATNKPCRESKS